MKVYRRGRKGEIKEELRETGREFKEGNKEEIKKSCGETGRRVRKGEIKEKSGRDRERG